MNVTVHPRFNALYYSYYIEGLRRLGATVAYGVSGFPVPGRYSHDCFAFISASPSLKVCIDARDGTFLDPAYLAWADVYAKVNLDDSSLDPTVAHKVMSIGPSFGVRTWTAVGSIAMAARTAMAAGRRFAKPREHAANYWRQFRHRLPERAYSPRETDGRYVFFAGSLWQSEPECNEHRARFIRACRSLAGIEFEGGFVPRSNADMGDYADCATPVRYDFAEYLGKLKRSALAFNTPAVVGCHGWKLGEFLALGKAIISTPLKRAMPAPLLHGTHVHVVDGTQASIQEAVGRICADDEYRARLQHGARAYYDAFLAPARVVERMIAFGEGRMVAADETRSARA